MCMYVCIYIYIYEYVCMCIYLYLYIYIYIYDYRTQKGNRDIAIKKLKVMISEAYIEPKNRIQYEGMNVYIFMYEYVYVYCTYSLRHICINMHVPISIYRTER
jgi:hypothetical protein